MLDRSELEQPAGVSVHPLRRRQRPAFESGAKSLSVVDLFAGCGGLTLGTAQAAHLHGFAVDVRLAVDFEEAAIRAFQSNFPSAKTQVAAVETLFDGELGSDLTAKELAVAAPWGPWTFWSVGHRVRATAT